MDDDDNFDLDIQKINFEEMEQDIKMFASEQSIQSVLEIGVDLQNYHSDISNNLQKCENDSINEYLEQAPLIEELMQEIKSCDDSLQSMEKLLLLFNESLGKIASDIYSLKEKSLDISIKLENRRNLESQLGNFVRKLAVTQPYVSAVTKGVVGEKYIPTIEQLTEKLNFINQKEVRDTLAASELKGYFTTLKNRAVDKIKKWFYTSSFELIRFPESLPVIQDQMLLCKSLYGFVRNYSPEVAKACSDYYIECSSTVYGEQFKQYIRETLSKMSQSPLQIETIIPQMQNKSFFGWRRNVGETTLFFSIDKRKILLDSPLAPPIDFGEGSYPLEALVRSLYMRLANAVTTEHSFASTFFSDESMTTSIFSDATQQLSAFFAELLPRIHDPVCIGVLLFLFNRFLEELKRRGVFRIDSHIKSVSSSLGERLRSIFQENLDAIEALDPSLFLKSMNPQTAHHANAMTRRFAEFASSMSLLVTDSEISDLIIPELHSVGAGVIDLLERTARGFGPGSKGDVFLINNYYLVSDTLRNRPAIPILSDLFDQKLTEATSHYVDLIIFESFRPLYDAVRNAFTKLESRDDPVKSPMPAEKLEQISVTFAQQHTQTVKTISDGQLMLFGDFANARNILRQFAKRLVLYWTRFCQLCAFMRVPRSGSLLSPQQLVLNIRPLTEAF